MTQTANMIGGATYEECVDELIAMASNAGHLGNEAITASARAYAQRDPRLTRAARKAAKDAQAAERALNSARSCFLSRWSATRSAGKTTP